jgi:hypothetical protein
MERLRKLKNFFRLNREINLYKRDHYYYTISSQYNYLERMMNDYSLEKTNVQTKRPIKFGYNLEFGLQPRHVVEKLGKPHFVYSNNKIQGHQIYFYKRKVYKYKIKLEIHFYNNAMFLGIYLFNEKPEEVKKIIADTCSKYSISVESFDNKNNRIADMANNVLDIDTKYNLVLAYIDQNNISVKNLINKNKKLLPVENQKVYSAIKKFHDLL